MRRKSFSLRWRFGVRLGFGLGWVMDLKFSLCDELDWAGLKELDPRTTLMDIDSQRPTATRSSLATLQTINNTMAIGDDLMSRIFIATCTPSVQPRNCRRLNVHSSIFHAPSTLHSAEMQRAAQDAIERRLRSRARCRRASYAARNWWWRSSRYLA